MTTFFLIEKLHHYDFDSSIKPELYETNTSCKTARFSNRALLEENKLEFASENAVEIGEFWKLVAVSWPFEPLIFWRKD